MVMVEVFIGEEETPTFTADFEFLPRIGEYLSRDIDGYFTYLNVTEIWHRQDGGTGKFTPRLRVERDD